MTSRRILLALLVTSTLATACGYYRSPADKLRESVLRYNDAVRWRHWKAAAAFVPAQRRDEFISRKEAEAETFRITDFEVRDVRQEDEGDTALVLIEFAWHRYPSLQVHRTRMRQTWSYETGAWLLEKQEEVIVEEGELRPEDMF